MMKMIRAFITDERGDIVQNIGWMVAVSVGAVVVGGLVYNGIYKYGQTTKQAIETRSITPPTTPTYDGSYNGK